MPIATHAQYVEMIDAAKAGRFAFPAVNVSSSETLNAALRGSPRPARTESSRCRRGAASSPPASPRTCRSAHRRWPRSPRSSAGDARCWSALHTDHCTADKLDGYLRPLLAISLERRRRGESPLFNSHMFDGSTLPLDENLEIASALLDECVEADIILEVECGVVGGEEDGVSGEDAPSEKLYTTPEDLLRVAEVLGTGERGRYLLAATFGNVHGVYAPGSVKLRPEVLLEGQKALAGRYGEGVSFDFVFHGGSGSEPEMIAEAVSYGVVKMNVDTDMQYAFTRPIAGHMLEAYSGVLKVDGGVGDKKAYDPRAWGRKGEASMAARVVQACEELGSAGKSIAAR